MPRKLLQPARLDAIKFFGTRRVVQPKTTQTGLVQ